LGRGFWCKSCFNANLQIRSHLNSLDYIVPHCAKNGRLHQSRQKEIPVYLPGERLERGEATLNEAAEALAISRTTIRWLIYTGLLPAQQLCKNAPWIVRHADLSSQEVRHEANYFTDAGYST
jgi:hypothetical protein